MRSRIIFNDSSMSGYEAYAINLHKFLFILFFVLCFYFANAMLINTTRKHQDKDNHFKREKYQFTQSRRLTDKQEENTIPERGRQRWRARKKVVNKMFRLMVRLFAND